MPTNDPDTIFGTSGNDTIDGLGGADLIYGLEGNDLLSGGLGSDTISGGDGDDLIRYSGSTAGGNDVLLGDEGRDTIDISFEQPPALTRNLYVDTGIGNDSIYFWSNQTHDSTLLTGNGDDTIGIFNSSLNSTIRIDTGPGNDSVISLGSATLGAVFLGTGDDHFTLSTDGNHSNILLGEGRDTIVANLGNLVLVDFSPNSGDVLDLGNRFRNTLIGWDGTNPFGTGYVKIRETQYGIEFLIDSEGQNNFVSAPVIKINAVKFLDLSSLNLNGFRPDGRSGAGTNSEGTASDDIMIGSSGEDTIDGFSGNDSIDGGRGGDLIFGGAGDDTIRSSVGNDTLYGGAGIDTFVYGSRNTVFFAQADNNLFVDNEKGLIFAGGHGVDRISSIEIFNIGFGNDSFIGGVNSETVVGGGGDDFLALGAGDDVVLPSDINVNGPWGDPTGSDIVLLQDGNDYVLTEINLDYFDGGSGVDTIIFSSQVDTLFFGTATYVYSFAVGYAFRNANTFSSLTGLSNAALNFEHAHFGAGNDTISGWLNAREIRGGGGNDWMADYASVNNTAGAGNNDRMFGEDGDDALYGLEGNDLLDGGAGIDIIVGGLGADTILGGAGADWMALGLNTGGTAGDEAADIVRFLAPSESTLTAMDAVVNFETGLDRLDLSAIDADTTLAGDQAFTLGALAAGQAGRLQITAPAGESWTLVQADVDGDGAADLTVIVYGASGQANLTAGDFVL